MCGICGQFNLGGQPVERAVIERMTASIRHRGPDSNGVFVSGPIGLGHQRLSIIDLSEAGNQPMRSPGGSAWIVFNGEVYNYAALKLAMERQGETFVSSSDTEVLLRLYERFGSGCLEKVNGMFAFAVWDAAAETLFLARDRIGIKPLYYYLDARVLVFASEIKALLQCPLVPREVNPEGFVTYFTFGHSFAPNTIYRGIKKLLPGHFLVCSSAGVRITKYWDLDDSPNKQSVPPDEAASEVRRLLREGVHSHMVSDVPVGAFLSGGIDSSAIVAFMSEASRYPVKTFAVGFDVGGY
jgi:asparagine synthase (glutamine-hydrolysing)